MVYCNVKYQFPLARGCIMITTATNSFQRWHIFFDLNAMQEESVQNVVICSNFKIKLLLFILLLEYLKICRLVDNLGCIPCARSGSHVFKSYP